MTNEEEAAAKLRDIAVSASTAMLLDALSAYLADDLKKGQDPKKYMDEEIAEGLRYLLDVLEGNAGIDDQKYIERHIEILDERMEVLLAYVIEALAVDEVIGLYYNERITQDIDLPVSAHRLLNEMMSYVTGDDDQEDDDEDDDDDSELIDDDADERIRDLLPLVPMPWSKQRFYDYVRDVLRFEFDYMDEEQIDETIQRLKETFTGRLEPNYGMFFAELAEEIDELQQLKPLKLSRQELTDAADRTVALIDELQDKVYFHSMTRQGLHILKSAYKGGIELFPKWAVAADLVDKLLQLTPTTVDPEYVDQLEERMTSALSEATKDSSADDEAYYERELEDFLESIEDIPEDMASELADVILQPVKYAARIDWEDLWSEEPADEEYLKAKIEEFIDFMDKTMADMPSMYRRVRMKNIMCKMPIGFGEIEEFIDYLHEALEFMPSDGALCLIESRFHDMIDQQDYEDDYDEDDEE
jgi:hypothetical protein